MVARLHEMSCAVITLVPEDWAETLKVAEKMPISDDMVVVMVREVPKSILIRVFVADVLPDTVTKISTGPDVGDMVIHIKSS